MYLLDTNVISELRKAKPHGAVLAGIRSIPEHLLYLGAFTLAENAMLVTLNTKEFLRVKGLVVEDWVNSKAPPCEYQNSQNRVNP